MLSLWQLEIVNEGCAFNYSPFVPGDFYTMTVALPPVWTAIGRTRRLRGLGIASWPWHGASRMRQEGRGARGIDV